MMNATSECPSATMASAMSAATSASVRPGTRNSGTRACTRSIAAPGLAQRVDLGGVLDHPQRAQHVGGQHRHHAEHVGQRQQVQRGHRVGDRGGDRRAAERVGHQLGTGRRRPPSPAPPEPSSVTADSFSEASSSRGTTMVGSPDGGQHQRGQPFERLRARPDQVAQVVAGRDDQPGQPGVGGAAAAAARRRCAYTSVLNRPAVMKLRLIGASE